MEYTEEQKARAGRRARLLELNKEAAKFFYRSLRRIQIFRLPVPHNTASEADHPVLNKEAAKFFYYQLRSPRGETGLKYLRGRELNSGACQIPESQENSDISAPRPP